MNMNDTLSRLNEVIETRKSGDPDKSYVARLFHKGPDAILKKIGEEATEVVMACKDADKSKIVAEMADLWFHCLLALNAHGLTPADVLAELERREGLSGLEEFASRKAQAREDENRSENRSENRIENRLENPSS
jgi:phosphoribosyl-ATP pyrophosphohydrolase